MVKVNHENGTVLIEGETSPQEDVMISTLRNNGYKVHVKRKANNRIHDTQYYLDRLEGEEKAHFQELVDAGKFMAGAHYGNKVLKEKK